jgi:hypothetical protein
VSARGLKFSEASHRYWLDGKPVPGVTTILGVLDKPALPKWAAGEVAAYVADHPDAIEVLRGIGRGPMIQALKGIPWQKRDDAGARGNVLHDYAERLLRGEDVDVADEHVAVMESAVAFLREWRIEPILIEAPVASREHRYAGKLDFVARYRRPDTGERGVAIFDWKSGKAIYPEFAWQLNAYAHAEFTGLDGDEHPLPECGAAFGVQIRADGFDVHPLAFGPDVAAEFVTIRNTFDIAKRGRGDWKRPGTGYVGIAIQSPEEGAA